MNKVPQGKSGPMKADAGLKGGVVAAPKAKKMAPVKVGSKYPTPKTK